MLWVFIGLLGGFALVFLTRLFWGEAANHKDAPAIVRSPLVTLAIITLITALVVMIATGRLHWLSALFTGLIPFLRRLTSLLRFAPLLQNLFGRTPPKPGQPRPPADSTLTLAQARAMLEVDATASKDEIVNAHRRLMARNHPDRGGSNFIAAQLNAAKDMLLEQHS